MRCIITMVLVAIAFVIKAQDASFAPADSEFVMKISRVKTRVIIDLTFKDSAVFDYLAIERMADYNQSFTQCKYLSYSDVKEKNRHVELVDNYPVAGSIDVLYRVRLATPDGATRVYPAITLAAVKK